MKNIKAKTNLEKMGFKDPDRANKNHDEIQLDILSNPKKFIKKLSKTKKFENDDIKVLKIELEKPITNGSYGKFIIGYVDVCIEFEVSNKKKSRTAVFKMYIEIKTKIDSFGDTLRQMNTYKEYERGSYVFCVVCPDDKFKEAFESQGVRFCKY